MSLAHPNVLTSFKTCIVRVLVDPEGTASADSGGMASAAPTASGSCSAPASQIVPSLTDRNALVEVVSNSSVLEPGF